MNKEAADKRQTKSVSQPDTVWTVGHSTHGTEEFLALLNAYDIEAIADVRRFPGSRRLPHFGEQQLKTNLRKNGIHYCLIAELGGRRRPAANTVNTAWRNTSFRGYADHLASEEFRTGMERLRELATRYRTALMCAEVLWWRCHRSLISDVLMVEGSTVIHIQDEDHSTEHPYTQPARLYHGDLTYNPAKGEPLNERERRQGVQTQMDI